MSPKSWLKNFTKTKCFDADTGNILNYITLEISNKTVREDLSKERTESLNRIFWVIVVVAFVMLLLQLVNYISMG